MGATHFIFTTLLGWKVEGAFDPSIKKAIIIGAPHTSWHDFYIAVCARRLLKTNIHFVGKKELFKWPFGWFFKKMGGVPLDRTKGQNKVAAIAAIFNEKKEFRLAISPEGTRKKVDSWKTGFYYIAKQAHVPIIPVVFDYGKKTFVVNPPFFLTDNASEDLLFLTSIYKNVKGKVPAYS